MVNTVFFKEDEARLSDLSEVGVEEADLRRIELALKLPPDTRKSRIDYVGIIEVGSNLLIFLPKSLKNVADKEKQTQQLIKLLSTVAQNKQVTQRIPDSSFFAANKNDAQLTRFDIAKFLLDDFSRNGQITFRNDSYVTNDIRNPDWVKTIGKVLPLESFGGAIYDKWISKKTDTYADRLIQQIHETVIHECLDIYGRFLGFNKNDFALISRYSAPTKNATSLINTVLRRTFVQRNIQILKALKRWVNFNDQTANLSFYGTRHFYVVWEEVCSFLMNNSKEASIWKSAFTRPKWTNFLTGKVSESDTFKIDILTELSDGLILADAKYYNTDTNYILGVEDVSKQIQYEKLLLASTAFQEKFEGDKDKLHNIFIFPGQHSEHIKNLCKVEFPVLHDGEMYGITFDTAESFKRYIERNSLSGAEISGITSNLP